MPKLVYLDNATTTKLDPEVLKAMEPYFTEYYGLPTAEYGHSFGLKAKEALEEARETVAKSIGAEPEEVVFTSGSEESNNLAIKGAAWASKEKNHLVTSKIERMSVLNVMKSLEKTGRFKASYLDVDAEGFVDLEQLKAAINKETLLVSVQHANHEIGTIQNIAEIGEVCHDSGVLFHVDADQSFTKLPINVEKMNIDLLSISAHMIHGQRNRSLVRKERR